METVAAEEGVPETSAGEGGEPGAEGDEEKQGADN